MGIKTKCKTSPINDSVKGIEYIGSGTHLVPGGLYDLYRVEGTREECIHVGYICVEDFPFVSLSGRKVAIVQPLMIPIGGRKSKVVGFLHVEDRYTVRAAGYEHCLGDPTEYFPVKGEKVSSADGYSLDNQGMVLNTVGGTWRHVIGEHHCGVYSFERLRSLSRNQFNGREVVEYVTFIPA